jgi:ATP synthase protein I
MEEQGDRERQARKASADQGLSDLAKGYRLAERYSAAGISLAAAVGIFTWLGHWVDGKVGTETPWFTIAGAVLGMAGGFISFFKTVLGKSQKP